MSEPIQPAARRGRPPSNPLAKAAAEHKAAEAIVEAVVEVAQAAADTAAPRRRRRAKLGQFARKLDAPQRPGFVRRWVNDTDKGRVAEAHELGYDFVTEAGIQSTDVGSNVSRRVGTTATGEPLRGYLMETPEELYAEGLAEKETEVASIDDALRAGISTEGQVAPEQERYGHVDISRGR